MPDSPDEVPSGLVFPGLRDASNRGPLVAFLVTVSLAGLAVLWPVYPLADSLQPFVLGLPFSFAWIVGWLGIVFVALVLFYRMDDSDSTG